MKVVSETRPLVYSCSGCSSVAQMTNYLAVQLDRRAIAEMSCIAGVGGNVKNLLHTAQSGRKIIVIDGCPLACSKACLINHSIQPSMHFELTSFGVKKEYHKDFDLKEAEEILKILELSIAKGKEKLGSILSTAKQINTSSAGISIEEVKTNKQMAEFINFPLRLYKGNLFYIPQLKKDMQDTFNKTKNPAFDFCEARYWLAYKDGKPAGRIAGIINYSFIKTWKQPFVRFGWFDFIEDETVARALLQKVEQWARDNEMIAVHGPLGFTNFDYAGMLTHGFNETGTLATIYNYPYYPEFMERAGYKKETGWVEYKIKITETIPEKIEKAASVVEKRLQLRVIKPTKLKEVLPYAVKIFELINSAYTGLFGMVPMTDKQIQYYIRKYLRFIKPEFISLVLDRYGELAGFAITMPSLSRALQKAKGKLYPFGFLHLLRAFKRNKLADLSLIAVRKDLQGKGVNAILIREINAAFIRHGIEYAESNPELEENTRVQSQWDYYETVQHKRRSCFIKYV
ncbi:MAG: putative zinc-binding protein [Sphingobacteriales bacterium]|nr:putative zinc-binding protein [Sphingobacteriales bacterium]